MEITFSGEVIEWRGPAPHHFVALPTEACEMVAEIAPLISYGWGVVPVSVTVGSSTWSTSLFPKDGGYFLPLRAAERHREEIGVGDVVTAALVIGTV